MLRREPITDPSKAVRCSECRHYQTVKYADGTEKTTCTGAMLWAAPKPDSFCSWGVRRDV